MEVRLLGQVGCPEQRQPDPRAEVVAFDPAAIEHIHEIKHLAPYVREYQTFEIQGGDNVRTMSLILSVATEFSCHLAIDVNGHVASPSAVLRAMLQNAAEARRL